MELSEALAAVELARASHDREAALLALMQAQPAPSADAAAAALQALLDSYYATNATSTE